MNFLKCCLVLISCCSLLACNEKVIVKEVPVVKEVIKTVPQAREEITLSFAPVIKKVAPAVVNIFAVQRSKDQYPRSPFMEDPFFKQFYDNLYPDKNRDQNSLGSGILVNADGLVLTNYHVIENADLIRVVMADKREYVAKLVVIDKKTDLALLKLEGGSNFPYLEIHPHQHLEVGDIVLAIGNPFGVGQTVTSGIVSALARSQEGISDFRSFIQTDAAINPGNSGGALITTDGRLVGLNTAIYSKTGGSMGIGFAVPIDLAIPVIASLENGGKITRPWLGLTIIPINDKISKEIGLPRPFGAIVTEVYPNGPGDKAGLREGDFILAMDGKDVEDDAALDYLIATSSVGATAQLTILRGGSKEVIPVVLNAPVSPKESIPILIKEKSPLKGATIETLSPELANKLGISPMTQAVIVKEVAQRGVAARLGVKPGDLLESINNHKIRNVEQALEHLRGAQKQWDIVMRRGKHRLSFQVRS